MSLDLHKIAGQIEEVASRLRTQDTDRAARLERALGILATAQPQTLEEKRVLSRATFLIPGMKDSLAGRYPCPPLPPDYAVLAVDGSHIDVDRHLALQCYLINIGTVRIQYGHRPQAALDSEPRLYTGEDSMSIVEPSGTRSQAIEGPLLGALRTVEELRALATQVKESDPEMPILALVDGSLIMWSLSGQAYPDFVRETLLEDGFLPALEELRALAQNRPLALAAYVSLPRSTDAVNALRLDSRLCPYEAANCDMHCGTLRLGQRPCDGVSGVLDRDLFGSLLDDGERSDLFASTSSIVERYYGEHAVHFYYLNVGSEMARVEVPRWVADNPRLLELTHALALDQSRRGHGYPVAISEAHEQAVVTMGDREEFRLLVESALEGRRLPVYTSQKNQSKRLKWL
ncbi:MAG: DNA double-strand break repair nuclease NurA [Chloroflexi bacterium]|nr:DNA double-strand break repair nuclease NurA [Chloroflexota bacterium]